MTPSFWGVSSNCEHRRISGTHSCCAFSDARGIDHL